jgi:hypothetical protein
MQTNDSLGRRVEGGLKGRAHYRGRAWMTAIRAPKRQGKNVRQCRRAFTALDRPLSTAQLCEWCFPGQPRKHWHYAGVVRAVRSLGAQSIGKIGRSHASVWTIA